MAYFLVNEKAMDSWVSLRYGQFIKVSSCSKCPPKTMQFPNDFLSDRCSQIVLHYKTVPFLWIKILLN